MIDRKICKNCSKYHAKIKSKTKHEKVCVLSKDDSSDDEDPENMALVPTQRSSYSTCVGSDIEIILDLPEWLKSPWTADDASE